MKVVLERIIFREIDTALPVTYSADAWQTITGLFVAFRRVAEVGENV
jgi:hypothetical protein